VVSTRLELEEVLLVLGGGGEGRVDVFSGSVVVIVVVTFEVELTDDDVELCFVLDEVSGSYELGGGCGVDDAALEELLLDCVTVTVVVGRVIDEDDVVDAVLRLELERVSVLYELGGG
jgi:hypothetical protein